MGRISKRYGYGCFVSRYWFSRSFLGDNHSDAVRLAKQFCKYKPSVRLLNFLKRKSKG